LKARLPGIVWSRWSRSRGSACRLLDPSVLGHWILAHPQAGRMARGFQVVRASVLARLKLGRSNWCTPGRHWKGWHLKAWRAPLFRGRESRQKPPAEARRLARNGTAALAGTVQGSRNELAARTNASQSRLDWQYETASTKQRQHSHQRSEPEQRDTAQDGSAQQVSAPQRERGPKETVFHRISRSIEWMPQRSSQLPVSAVMGRAQWLDRAAQELPLRGSSAPSAGGNANGRTTRENQQQAPATA